MIRHLLAALIGGVVLFVYLLIWNATQFTDPIPAFAIAGVVAAIGTYLWPFVVGLWLVGRAKDRRDAQIQKEVDKRMGQGG
jgi:xanthine/uracil permease